MRYVQILMMLCLIPLAGCARSSAEQPGSSRNSELILRDEPVGALDVIGVREDSQDDQPVVVVGRVGVGSKPWIEGRAAFTLVDQRVVAGCEGQECEADCPKCAEELVDATILVKFHDAKGKVLSIDARELLGLKDQQIVVVRGVANRDEAGSISIVGSAVYAKE